MKIYITSVFVDDQAKALDFYTNTLGFSVKHNEAVGEHRWLTVTAKDDPNGPELLLEPSVHKAVPPFKTALVADGIPFASFQVNDLDAECKRLKGLGVEFTQGPSNAGTVKIAVLDDTCGNLVQLVEVLE
jgi:catechol 2,3-dioxygenase-like lactoylglutathione lyase family enzyme